MMGRKNQGVLGFESQYYPGAWVYSARKSVTPFLRQGRIACN